MQITLDNNEIVDAVKAYLDNIGIASEGKNVDIKIDFTMGRGDNGLSATVKVTKRSDYAGDDNDDEPFAGTSNDGTEKISF